MASDFMAVETILKINEKGRCSIQSNVNGSMKTSGSGSSSTPPDFGSTTTLIQKWKAEPHQEKMTDLNLIIEDKEETSSVNRSVNDLANMNQTESEMLIKPWPLQTNHAFQDQKFYLTTGFSQQFPCSFQGFPADEKFFLQFDYKTRNKLKTKQRRLDPFYRNQERIRQRTVMRIKRQDPRFRAVEREKGRYRMRVKRLDPIFRSKERERQRERMKIKRRDPTFREREREQQKNRLNLKRINSRFKDKEKATDPIKRLLKCHNNGSLSSLVNPEKYRSSKSNIDCTPGSMQICLPPCTDEMNATTDCHDCNPQSSVMEMLPEHLTGAKLIPPKDKDFTIQSLHCRKSHIVNLNFCNCYKERVVQAEVCAKIPINLNCTREDLRLCDQFHLSSSNEKSFLVPKVHSDVPDENSTLNVGDGSQLHLSSELTKNLSSEVQMSVNNNRPFNVANPDCISLNSSKFNSASATFSSSVPSNCR